MWRATLKSGLVVDHDGHNTPLDFLDQIVRFEVFAPNGAKLAEIEPGPGERVLWRWDRAIRGGERLTLGCKLGVASGGEIITLKHFDGQRWTDTRDITLEALEAA